MSTDVRASEAAELANCPACHALIPIDSISSITIDLESFLFPQTRTSQSIDLLLFNNSAEIF